MTSTTRFPLSSPIGSPRRLPRLDASTWRCYADLRVDVRLLAVAAAIIGVAVGAVRCNSDATAWVGLYDPRPLRRIRAFVGLAVTVVSVFVITIVATSIAAAASPVLGWFVFVAIPVVGCAVLVAPFVFGRRRVPALSTCRAANAAPETWS